MTESPTNHWNVEIVTKGPHGNVIYREGRDFASFYWEFGGGNVVAIIHVPQLSDWNQQYPWAADRRAEVLSRLASEVIRQKAPDCTANLVEDHGRSYLHLRQR